MTRIPDIGRVIILGSGLDWILQFLGDFEFKEAAVEVDVIDSREEQSCE